MNLHVNNARMNAQEPSTFETQGQKGPLNTEIEHAQYYCSKQMESVGRC